MQRTLIKGRGHTHTQIHGGSITPTQFCWKICLSWNNNSPSSRCSVEKSWTSLSFSFIFTLPSLYLRELALVFVWANFTAVCFSLKSLIHDLCSPPLSCSAYFTSVREPFAAVMTRRKNTALFLTTQPASFPTPREAEFSARAFTQQSTGQGFVVKADSRTHTLTHTSI